MAVIDDYVRDDCNTVAGGCPSVPVTAWFGKTIQHKLTVRYGLSGTFVYNAIDVATGQTLISYSVTGDTGASGSIKFGTYRAMNSQIQASSAMYGDYVAKRLE